MILSFKNLLPLPDISYIRKTYKEKKKTRKNASHSRFCMLGSIFASGLSIFVDFSCIFYIEHVFVL